MRQMHHLRFYKLAVFAFRFSVIPFVRWLCKLFDKALVCVTD
jgi:hypothetical protein